MRFRVCVEVGYIYCLTLSGPGVESNAGETFLYAYCVCPARLKGLSHCIEPFKPQWSLYVPPVATICTASDHYMYRQFNIQQFYVQPTQCIYVFCVDLRTNSHYFPI